MMLKYNVQYKDLDGKPAQKQVYFNLQTNETVELLPLLPRFEAWNKKAEGGDRDLTSDEVYEMVQIIKTLVDLSYGVREGDLFRKTPELLADFKAHPAYDGFVMQMFVDPGKANDFMEKIMPAGLEELAAAAEARKQGVETEKATTVELPSSGGEMTAVTEEVPAWIREQRDPTPTEVRSMTPAQMQAEYLRKMGNGPDQG